MTGTVVMASLPLGGTRLVRLMQGMGFGRIELLHVRNGEPVFDQLPRVIREVKFCAENGARPEAIKKDFALKAQVRELFAEMDEMGDGVILCIEVKHGLPFKMTWEDAA